MTPKTVEDFAELVNTHGLVPMLITRSFAPYTVDKIAGFQPEVAFKMFKNGYGVPWSEKDGVLARNAPETPKEPDAPDRPVEIPETWRDLHNLQRIKLAKKITGVEGNLTVAGADEIIEAEVNRRSMTHGTEPHEA